MDVPTSPLQSVCMNMTLHAFIEDAIATRSLHHIYYPMAMASNLIARAPNLIGYEVFALCFSDWGHDI